MMKRFLPIVLIVAGLAVCSCGGAEMVEPQNDNGIISLLLKCPALTELSVKDNSFGNKINISWSDGDKIWLFDNSAASVSSSVLVSGDRSSVSAEYTFSNKETKEVWAASMGSDVVFSVPCAETSTILDGALPHACFMAGFGARNAKELLLESCVGILKIALSETEAVKAVVKTDIAVFPTKLKYDFSSRALNVQTAVSEVELSIKSDNRDYYLPITPGTKAAYYSVSLYDRSDILIASTEIPNDYEVSSGRVYSLKDIGAKEPDAPQGEAMLSVRLPFKQEDKLLDCSAQTGAGSYWPFVEYEGSSARSSTNQILHAKNGRYPVVFSGPRHYLNPKNGWTLCPRVANDYVEFPTFAKGRIKSVTIAFGSSPCNPSFVDGQGNIIKGGAQKSGTVSSVLYTYDLEDTRPGEPCRMVLNTKDNVHIMQVTPTYIFDYQDIHPANDFSGVYLSDLANSVFSSGGVSVAGSIEGSAQGDMSCGILCRDFYSDALPVSIDCTPSAFDYSIDSPSSSKYLFRTWASGRNGWREYSPEAAVYPFSVAIDFLKEGTLNKAVGEDSFAGGAEQTRTLAGTDYKLGFKGTFAYDTESGLVVSSDGKAYVRLPAIEGKAIAEVLVLASDSSADGDVFVAYDPADAGSAASPVEEFKIGVNNPVTLACTVTSGNTPYCLVFASAKVYKISRIVAVYKNDSIPTSPLEEEENDASADPTGLFDYASLATKGHPRLLLDAAGFAEIRRKITAEKASNRVLAEVSDNLISVADNYITSQRDITYTMDASGGRLLQESQNALLQLSSMSYAYQITGNEKYLSRARVLLAQICAFNDWHPSHFLDVAEMTMAVAIAYDWLYNALSLEERKLIHARIVNYGLSTSYGQFYLAEVSNWNQVCASGMVAGALAVYEKDKNAAYKAIEQNVISNRAMAKEIYYPDGNYTEGYSYWGYGTGFQAIMMRMLDVLFGHNAGMDNIPGLDKTAEYMLFMDGITASFSYADGGALKINPKNALWYFAAKNNDGSLLSNELKLLKKGEYMDSGETRMMFLLPSLLKDFQLDFDVPAYPCKDLWSGGGVTPVVMVHTGWKWDATDHYLGIKGGDAGHSHCHMDAGSFVYDALGRRWSADLGKMQYADMTNAFEAVGGGGSGQTHLQWDVLKYNNYGHSTISVNAFDGSFTKRYPSDYYYLGKANVTAVIETATELGATLDMSAPLLGCVASATRTIKLVNNKDLVIIDVITAKNEFDAPVMWHMITPAVITKDSDCEILTQGWDKMYLKTSASPSIPINYKATDYVRPDYFTPRDWDVKQSAYIAGFECTVPAGTTVTLTTVLSPDRQ